MPSSPSHFSDLVLIGHPFAPTGVGQLIRSTIASLRAVAQPFKVLDCYGYYPEDKALALNLVTKPGRGINLFHINGDEVESFLSKTGAFPSGSYNIVFPAWELPTYPAVWARQLDRFDEVWGFSEFVTQSLQAAVHRPVYLAPLSISPVIHHYHSRSELGIPGSSLVFCFSFDCSSFPERKNPWAVIEAFRQLQQRRPQSDAKLVLKVSGGDRAPSTLERLRKEVATLGSHAQLIDRTLSAEEMKSLLMACDCFISLHRSEGYGLCLAEAMYFGKPVIATAYSGNLDFMSAETALLVNYDRVAVKSGSYPHGEGQFWAEPSITQAVDHMVRLVDHPAEGRALGALASAWIRRKLSPLALGLAYRSRLETKYQNLLSHVAPPV